MSAESIKLLIEATRMNLLQVWTSSTTTKSGALASAIISGVIVVIHAFIC